MINLLASAVVIVLAFLFGVSVGGNSIQQQVEQFCLKHNEFVIKGSRYYCEYVGPKQ